MVGGEDGWMVGGGGLWLRGEVGGKGGAFFWGAFGNWLCERGEAFVGKKTKKKGLQNGLGGVKCGNAGGCTRNGGPISRTNRKENPT